MQALRLYRQDHASVCSTSHYTKALKHETARVVSLGRKWGRVGEGYEERYGADYVYYVEEAVDKDIYCIYVCYAVSQVSLITSLQSQMLFTRAQEENQHVYYSTTPYLSGGGQSPKHA